MLLYCFKEILRLEIWLGFGVLRLGFWVRIWDLDLGHGNWDLKTQDLRFCSEIGIWYSPITACDWQRNLTLPYLQVEQPVRGLHTTVAIMIIDKGKLLLKYLWLNFITVNTVQCYLRVLVLRSQHKETNAHSVESLFWMKRGWGWATGWGRCIAFHSVLWHCWLGDRKFILWFNFNLCHCSVAHIGVKYNEEKEQKAKWDAKQKELARIEEAKKREAEKGLFFSIVMPILEVHLTVRCLLHVVQWILFMLLLCCKNQGDHFMENLEMSRDFTVVREMSGEKSCQGKLFSANFTFVAFEHTRWWGTLLVSCNWQLYVNDFV